MVATPRQELQRNRECVPTAAQGEAGEADLLFHKVLRRWIASASPQTRLLRRVEERILVRAAASYAAESLSPGSQRAEEAAAIAEQIRQDAGLWAEALADLASRAVDLDTVPFDDEAAFALVQETRARLAHPDLSVVLAALSTLR